MCRGADDGRSRCRPPAEAEPPRPAGSAGSTAHPLPGPAGNGPRGQGAAELLCAHTQILLGSGPAAWRRQRQPRARHLCFPAQSSLSLYFQSILILVAQIFLTLANPPKLLIFFVPQNTTSIYTRIFFVYMEKPQFQMNLQQSSCCAVNPSRESSCLHAGFLPLPCPDSCRTWCRGKRRYQHHVALAPPSRAWIQGQVLHTSGKRLK